MTLNKEEFKVMAMLYTANIDGNIHVEEIKAMLEKTDKKTYQKVLKEFNKMNDAQVFDCIKENKALYANNDADKQQLMADLRTIIEADEKVTLIEGLVCKALERMLE